MTIIYSKTRLRVNCVGDGAPGHCHVGWGPVPMVRVPRWVAKLAVRRLMKLSYTP